MQKRFQLSAQADQSAELIMYGAIGGDWWGSGITDSDVAEALGSLDENVKTLNVRINSPGGDATQGFAIYNLLSQHRVSVNMYVDGWAASAASIILMAGDTRYCAENGMVMIHDSWSVGIGNKKDMAKLSDVLNKLDGNIALTYSARTGKPQTQVSDWMSQETWFTGQEAKDNGFCDEIVPAKGAGDTDEGIDDEVVARFAAHYKKGAAMMKRPSSLKADLKDIGYLRDRLNLLRRSA